MTDLEITTLAERPDRMALTADLHDPDVPPFLYKDPVSAALFVDLVAKHPAYTMLAVEPDTGRPAAMMCTVPFTPAAEPPPGGYDAVLLAAAADTLAGRTGTTASALFATVRPDLRGRGLSTVILNAALANTARLGHDTLLAPVRPTHKHQHPTVAMADYLTWRRSDGTLADPWLRVHEHAGGHPITIAPHSMTITATLHQWRTWTGLPFDAAGPILVPGALAPVLCDPQRDIATYIEPNVWYRHDLDHRNPRH
jgi:GNAT superfamily N-acetyltransferase